MRSKSSSTSRDLHGNRTRGARDISRCPWIGERGSDRADHEEPDSAAVGSVVRDREEGRGVGVSVKQRREERLASGPTSVF